MDLTGKRIIVTGGARGMGEATVRTYVNAGARVVSMDITDDLGQDVVAAANAGGDEGPGRASFRHVDLSDRQSVEAAFADAVDELGGLDVLAHPAAIQRTGVPHDISDDDWDLMVGVNVRGTMLTNRAAFGAMRDGGGGSIINFGSRAFGGPPLQADYGRPRSRPDFDGCDVQRRRAGSIPSPTTRRRHEHRRHRDRDSVIPN